jgi:heme-degrading monooxygenase HmoA
MAATLQGTSVAYLLQDPTEQRRFFSLGPWESADAILAWRNSNEFGEFMAKVEGMYDGFQPNLLHQVAVGQQG